MLLLHLSTLLAGGNCMDITNRV